MKLDGISGLAEQSVMEQATQGLMQFAAALGSYFRKLMEEGFEREEAFDLVLQYQLIIASQARQ